MKNLYLLLAASTISISAYAASLSPQQALDRAFQSSQLKSVSNMAEPNYSLVYTEKFDEVPMVYLFKNDSGKGFLLLSADEAAYPLLGYTDEMTLPQSSEQYAPGFKYWIQFLSQQIAKCGGNANSLVKAPKNNGPAISPMTVTKWNQDAPYNDDCPQIGDRHCYTGCVATALAQIMKYHEYPSRGSGSHSYAWHQSSTVTDTLSFNFGETDFDWTDMLVKYGSSINADPQEKSAVASLMYACGVAVNMGYGTSESGASTTLVAPAMINYFNYDKGARQYMRDYYTLDDWNQLVYDQLKNYGPVQYSGFSNQGGHSFVCDGYDGNGYFHINWGWGGMSDGYFLLTALDPGEQGIGGSTSGYNFSQDIIGNVSKYQVSTSIYEQVALDNEFNIEQSSVALGQDILVASPVFNTSSGEISDIYLGLKLTPTDGGDPVYIKGNEVKNWGTAYGFGGYYVRIPVDLAQGNYTATPAFLNSQGEWNPILVKVNVNGSYDVTVSGTTATFEQTGSASISVTDFIAESEFRLGSEFMTSATLTNNSQKEYLGTLTVALYKNETDESPALVAEPVAIDLPANTSQYWEFVSEFTTNDTTALGNNYAYIVEVDNNSYKKLAGPLNIELLNKSSYSLSADKFEFAAKQERSNVQARIEITCTSGYFFGQLRLGLAEKISTNEWEFIDWIYSDYITLQGASSSAANGRVKVEADAPATEEVSFVGDFSEVEDGKTYACAVYEGNNRLTDLRLFEPIMSTGLDALEREDCQIQYFTIDGVLLTSRPTNKGIYIVKRTENGKISTGKLIR